MRHERIIDFDDRREKADFLARAGALTGKWRFVAERYRPRRSLKANAFYWAAIVPAFQQFMRSHGSYFDKDEVHEFFLQKFSSRDVVDPATGELMAVIGYRSSKMDSEQFSAFVNTCIEWMHDRFGIVVPEPGQFQP